MNPFLFLALCVLMVVVLAVAASVCADLGAAHPAASHLAPGWDPHYVTYGARMNP